jgi:hypothetical protein
MLHHNLKVLIQKKNHISQYLVIIYKNNNMRL